MDFVEVTIRSEQDGWTREIKSRSERKEMDMRQELLSAYSSWWGDESGAYNSLLRYMWEFRDLLESPILSDEKIETEFFDLLERAFNKNSGPAAKE